MTVETRSHIAEQARVYIFFAFIAAIGCWPWFAHELHVELQSGYSDEFGWPLAISLLGAVLSTVLLMTSLAVAWLHRYLDAPVAAPAVEAEATQD